MFWYKGWLETRFRFCFALGFTVFFLGSAYAYGLKTTAALHVVIGTATVLVAMFCGQLAGAGIATQPAVQATAGLHGSTLFTLSLPVSRLHLLAVRASLGWLQVAGGIALYCGGMWVLFPIVRDTASGAEMLEYAGVLIGCASGLLFISVLLATFLDDLWRMYGTMMAFGALWWASKRVAMPDSVNVFRAMGEGSPLVAHSIPWAALGVSAGLAAVLFLVSLKIVQQREY
ncbi:MAG TPA: hypothetical protein VGN17_27560 [Bryobacteraceae bacterium]|jgi:hypothetical protein